MKISNYVTFDVVDFAIGLDNTEASAIIKIVDQEQQCANFTFDMAEYFIREVMKYAEDTDWVNDLKLILENAQ